MSRSYKDLSDWIAALEKLGELVRVHAEVDPHLEITEIADRVVKGGGPALLFENVAGSDLPVLINQFGSERRMCLALGVESYDEVGARIGDLVDLQPPQGLVDKMKALGKLRELASFGAKSVRSGSCQDIWLDPPDLDRVPILTCWPEDGGPFITLPLVFSSDPRTGARNCGMYRIQKVDRRTALMHWQIHKDDVGSTAVRLKLDVRDSIRLRVNFYIDSNHVPTGWAAFGCLAIRILNLTHVAWVSKVFQYYVGIWKFHL